MKNVFNIILSFCGQHIWVTLSAIQANRKIQRQVKDEESNKVDLKLFTKKIEDAKRIIEGFNNEHLERKKILEEKGRALLLIVTASITLTASILIYVYNLKESHNFSLTILILGYTYLILCIFDVLDMLNTTEYYYIGKESYFKPIEGTSDVEFENFDATIGYIELLHRNTQLNSKKNLIKQNRLYSAFENLRNGIILICFFFILSIVQKMVSTTDSVHVPKISQNEDTCPFIKVPDGKKDIQFFKTPIAPVVFKKDSGDQITDTTITAQKSKLGHLGIEKKARQPSKSSDAPDRPKRKGFNGLKDTSCKH